MPSLVSRARTTVAALAIEPFLPTPIAACRKTTSAASLSLTISSRSTIRSSGTDETLAITAAAAFARLAGRVVHPRARRSAVDPSLVDPECGGAGRLIAVGGRPVGIPGGTTEQRCVVAEPHLPDLVLLQRLGRVLSEVGDRCALR